MMEKAKHSIQFETVVRPDGTVAFSQRVTELQLKPGSSVTVNIFGGVLSETLTRLGVTESEIEQVGSVQLEDREHVMTFLSSQGAVKGNKRFIQRLKRMLS